ncbi:hypothetical protein [Winogradskyella poriferorum]|uniref:Gliding motility-associated protein GldM N-terminal domain-containing protein n=1 Tax=Winogradskyella poriferorum TaxID=307627 RepID=A0ABU7W0G6_9FLAO
MRQIQIKKTFRLTTFLMLTLVLFQNCKSIRLISEYDEITDKTVTAVQEKVSGYFVKLENSVGTKESSYDNYKEQFEQIKIDLNTLEVRAKAIDKNRIVIEQVKELQNMIANLEKLHKSFGENGYQSYDLIEPNLNSFNSAFTAIIKLQLALKRGEKTKEDKSENN